MTALDEWASRANDAVRICLRHGETDNKSDEIFHPAFTYPIFGEEEVIFGYQSLKVKLDFQADSLDSGATITWKSKYAQVGETKADNVEEKLSPFWEGQEIVAGQELEVSPPSLKGEKNAAFTPPGELLQSYEVDGRKYGIWSASLADPATKELLRKMQIFVLFFIEGGSCIQLDDPPWTIERWRVFLIYEIIGTRRSYSFVGYSTTYRLTYVDTSAATQPPLSVLEDWPGKEDAPALSSLPSRVRISQFLILPPHQSRGHGTYLYTTMMATFNQDPTVREITVEDPNESFDDLRDFSDMTMLRLLPDFTSLRINDTVQLPAKRSQPLPTAALLNTSALAAAQTTSKIADRQFKRLVEMHLLAQIPARHRSAARITRKDRATDPQDRAYYFWRLLVKQRLYKHNLDQLAQLEPTERVEKLDETLAGVEADYVRILEALERRGGLAPVAPGGEGSAEAAVNGANGSARRAAKRKVLDDDEDDNDDEEAGNGRAESVSSKRARVEDE